MDSLTKQRDIDGSKASSGCSSICDITPLREIFGRNDCEEVCFIFVFLPSGFPCDLWPALGVPDMLI